MLAQVRHCFNDCVYVAWMSRVCAHTCVCKEIEAFDTSLTSQLRQPVSWRCLGPHSITPLNALWLSINIKISTSTKERKFFMFICLFIYLFSKGCWLATIFHTSKEGVGINRCPWTCNDKADSHIQRQILSISSRSSHSPPMLSHSFSLFFSPGRSTNISPTYFS